MPVRTGTESGLRYYLVSFDADGNERPEPTGELLSRAVVDECANGSVTDVFLVSHGWMGDVPAAIRQYDRWIAAMGRCTSDLEALRKVDPLFQPLVIGLHWPSLPWGDEELGSSSFSAEGAGGIDEWIARYAARIADTPNARSALRTVFETALEDVAPAALPAAVRNAYVVLDRETGMSHDGDSPDDDRECFDPDFVYEESTADEMASFDAPWYGGILSPLRLLSFWKMKNRSRLFGEGAARMLLRELQRASPPAIRYHLIGHSFGCIVASSMLRGRGVSVPLDRPVQSLTLMQGALSLWSFCAELPHKRGTAGYFNDVIHPEYVAGPVLTTQSEHDTAVGFFYPIAAGARRQIAYAAPQLPKYGALGTYGARGPGLQVVDLGMLPVTGDYGFRAGAVYNIDATEYICDGRGMSGAHNDIAKPQIAHAIWQAVQVRA